MFKDTLRMFIYRLFNNKFLQFFILGFWAFVGGLFNGYGDVIQNYWHPTNFEFGVICKIFGLIMFFGSMSLIYRKYQPYEFEDKRCKEW